jgi:hypothetical protein
MVSPTDLLDTHGFPSGYDDEAEFSGTDSEPESDDESDAGLPAVGGSEILGKKFKRAGNSADRLEISHQKNPHIAGESVLVVPRDPELLRELLSSPIPGVFLLTGSGKASFAKGFLVPAEGSNPADAASDPVAHLEFLPLAHKQVMDFTKASLAAAGIDPKTPAEMAALSDAMKAATAADDDSLLTSVPGGAAVAALPGFGLPYTSSSACRPKKTKKRPAESAPPSPKKPKVAPPSPKKPKVAPAPVPIKVEPSPKKLKKPKAPPRPPKPVIRVDEPPPPPATVTLSATVLATEAPAVADAIARALAK